MIPKPLNSYQPEKAAFAEKTILVTGAGTGIGRALTIALAHCGAQVITLGPIVRDLEEVHDTVRDQALPAPAIYPMNLEGASYQDFEQLASVVDDTFGGLDGVVHNAASLGTLAPMRFYDPTTWARVFQVNVHSPFMLTQTCLSLLERSADASVVFSADSVGRIGRAYWGAYSASKFALEGMMQTLAAEYEGRDNLRFNSLDPGPVRTAMRSSAYPGEDPATVVEAEEIVNAYLYLLGPDAHTLTGKTLTAQ
jgi:NAD(P)-dependent dehydrogenase (short-subunit alcohol dehydrogenase family)